MKKYGIFLVNGSNERYAQWTATGLTKLHVKDFDSVDDALEFIRENRIGGSPLILEFWV